MNIKIIQAYFLNAKQKALIRAYPRLPGRQPFVVIKAEEKSLAIASNYFERLRPDSIRFVYKKLNIWDRFLLRKHPVRVEMR